MLVGGKWFWCCKDNIIFPLRHHRTARVFPTPRAFSVRPPHSARWAAPNCALLPYLFTSSAPFFSFLLLFYSPFRYKEANIGNFPLKVPCFSSKLPLFHPFSPTFYLVTRTAHPPRAVRCIFPPHLRLATGVKRTNAPLASSSRLLRFQTSPSTRPIPPHTSVFSGSFIHNYPLPQVVNPTFLPTYRRHIFET